MTKISVSVYELPRKQIYGSCVFVCCAKHKSRSQPASERADCCQCDESRTKREEEEFETGLL